MVRHARHDAGERFFEDLCEGATDLIFSADPDGRIRYANRAMIRALALDPSEIAAVSLIELAHAESEPRVRQALAALLAGSKPVHLEAVLVARDGSRVPVDGWLDARTLRGGSIAIRGIVRNAAREEQARLELDRLFEHSLDVLCVADFDGRFRRVNPSFERVLGWTGDDLRSLRFLDLVHPGDRDGALRELTGLLAGRVILDYECRYRAKDDSWKTLVWRAVPIPERELVYVNARDVSEERRMAALVTRQAEDLDRLFSMSKDMLCVAGTDGFFKRVNPAFREVLGYSEQELLEVPFVEFVHPDDRDDTVAEVTRLARGEPTIDFHNRYRAKDGGWRWLQWRATPLPDRGLIYAIARDATERVRMQQRLEDQAEKLARSNADLEQFAAVASHDLQAPLRHAAQLARWIEADMPGALPARVVDHLRGLDEKIERMERLTGDILRYARADRPEDEVDEVDTRRLVEDVVRTLSPPNSFHVRTEGRLPRLVTDRSALEQVFRNLIGNAIAHHDRDAGTVVVAAPGRGEPATFTVTDDGPGIPGSQRAAIFEMFHTGGKGKRGGGSGIGLAVVKKLVTRRGGTISVEDAGGRGTRFRFTWPTARGDED